MTYLKVFGAVAALAFLSQPALAQNAPMVDGKMDQTAMDLKVMADQITDLAPETSPEIITAKVNGMVCDFCAQALNKVFKKEDAVDSLNVDLDAGEVQIALKPQTSLSDDTIAELIRNAGYSLVDITREDGA